MDAKKLADAYRNLTRRQKLIGAQLKRTYRNRFGSSPNGVDLYFWIFSAEEDLEDIPDWAINRCFINARKNHFSNMGLKSAPFEISEVVAEYWRMYHSGELQKYSPAVAALPPGPVCQYCNGKRWMRLRVKSKDEKRVVYAGTKRARSIDDYKPEDLRKRENYEPVKWDEPQSSPWPEKLTRCEFCSPAESAEQTGPEIEQV